MGDFGVIVRIRCWQELENPDSILRCTVEEMSQAKSEKTYFSDLDRLLSKYVAVWLWSITFGGTSALAYNLIGSSFARGAWGTLSFALAALAALGMVLIAVAWLSLYHYFATYLLPSFFHEITVERQSELSGRAARQLATAVRFTILAGLLSLIGAILRLGFSGF